MTTTTTPSTHERLALRYLELIATGDNGPEVETVIHPEFAEHRLGLHGRDGFRETMRRVNVTFADITNSPVDTVAAGDRVAARTRMRALHVGPFQQWEPTNRAVEIEQMHIWRIEDGLLAEHWLCMDELSLLRQIGAL